MKTILKHILRNIKEKKGRSLLIILSLIVASCVFTINIVLPDEILLKVEETLRNVYGDADIQISSLNSFKIEDLNLNNENIDYFGYLDTEIYIGNNPALLTGIDINKAKEFKLLDEDVPNLKDNEVVISKNIAKNNSYKEGEIISVIYDEKEYELKIVKIVNNKGLNSIDIGSPIFISNLNTAKVMHEFDDEYDGIYINIDDNKINDYADYLKEHNDKFNITKLVDSQSIKDQTKMVSSIMLLLFAISTIMIFFVINSLNKIIIAERMPVIGTFRSVGATKSKMNFILILENALYGLIGGTIGSFAAYSLKNNLVSSLITAEGVELSNKTGSISFGVIVLSIVFTILLQIFISINAIRKANKKSVKEIIFDVQSSRYKFNKRKIIIGTIIFTLAIIINAINTSSNIILVILSLVLLITGINYVVPLMLMETSKLLTYICKKCNLKIGIISSKNIGYNKMIISLSRLIVISLSLMLSIFTITFAVNDVFEGFRYVVKDANIIVEGIGKSYKEYEDLIDVDGIEKVKYMFMYMDNDMTYNNGKKFKNLPIIMGEEESSSYIIEIDYQIKDLKADEILIDEKYKDTENINVGDILKLNIKGITNEFKVAGYINGSHINPSRNIFVMNLDYFKENIYEVPYQIHLKVKDGVDIEGAKINVDKKLKEMGVRISSFDEYLEKNKQSVSGIINIMYIIIGLGVLLSFIGIINNQIINFIQRKKELAVLNSTCMSKKQIKKMLLFETVFANIFSCIMGVLISYILVIILKNFVKGIMVYIDLIFDWNIALIMSGILIVVLLLTLIAPFHKLNKMKIIEEIKYE